MAQQLPKVYSGAEAISLFPGAVLVRNSAPGLFCVDGSSGTKAGPKRHRDVTRAIVRLSYSGNIAGGLHARPGIQSEKDDEI